MRKRLSTILLLTGSAVLVWCASVWISSALFERRQSQRWNNPPPAVSAVPLAPRPHDVVAWLDIPRLHISTAVLEGDDTLSLRYGAGHVPGTPLPGSAGNVGIAAHRDTIFRPLSRIARDDRITLRTPGTYYEYSVESTSIVRPSDVSVLDGSNTDELTLVTCYPFWYVGPAPLRFVVRARRVS